MSRGNLSITAATLMCAALVSACAFDVVHLTQTPAVLEPVAVEPTRYLLNQELEVNLGTGYSRKLRAGTRWEAVGSIEQGEVLKTRDQILTVEASNVYEAYIVVSNHELVGFYLPVERTYSPLSKSHEIQLETIDPHE